MQGWANMPKGREGKREGVFSFFFFLNNFSKAFSKRVLNPF
jgi:hypothetical protein